MQRLRQALQQVRKWLGDLLAEEQVWIADVGEAVWAALQRLARLLMVAGERVAAWVAERPERMLSRPREFERSRALRFWLVRLLQVALFLPLLWVGYYLLTRETTYLEIPAYASAPQQRVLVVHNSQDIYGEEAYANAVRALDYARLQHDDLDLAAELSWPALPEYSSVLFLTELLDTIDEGLAQQLADYVANGGGLVVAYRGWNPYLAALFGMKATQDFPRMLEGEGGLTFEADFFPGVKGLKLSTKTIPDLSSFDVPLQKDVQVMARSEAGRPIVWLYRHEQGRVLYWNTVFLADKEARGFIVQSIMNAQPVGVLPVANFATLQVDDFPASISTEKIEPVATEYDMTLVEFYDKVWFPDMMDIAERYGVVYTFLIPFNYNALVEPPFNFREWEHAEVHVDDQPVFYSIYVSHLAAQKHELGLHGYNHISLSLENWPSEENMVAGLQAAWQRWDEDNLGPHPITYVPPNNIYDEAGARALTRGFPSLKILAGIYTGSFESGGDREFGPEPWNPELFDIPRITFGYNLTPRYRFALLSELGMMGIWTTFIHPDDVVHTPENYPHSPYHRNPNYWPWRGDHTGEKNGFYYRFLRWLDFVKAYYPWLRFVRTDESLDILRRHLENQVTVEMQPFGLTVHTTPDTYFQVRINDARRVFLNDLEGAQFVHVYHGGGYALYVFHAVKDTVNLKLLVPARIRQIEEERRVVPTLEYTGEEDISLQDFQDERIWQTIGIATPGPGAPVVATATPEFGGLPQATPTPRELP